MPATVDHVVVLALENRSFDHLLGFAPHPDPAFDGLLSGGPYTNPPWRGGGPPIPATPDAKRVLPVDPDHSHDAVMQQLQLQGLGPARRPTMQGFVASYEEKGRGLAPPRFEGLLGPLANWWVRRKAAANPIPDRGREIMRCQPHAHVAALTTLALQFGVCSKWFSSVPGETWPNRNFMHAATSDGTVDNDIRFYFDGTVFDQLERNRKTWRIYYDDTPQVWAFRKLWEGERLGNWFPFPDFARHVEQGELPHYSFIEPNHRPPVHLPWTPGSGPEHSNNQHPGNNLIPNDAYDAHDDHGDGGDFERGEQLIATVYETLRSNPALFERTLLLITYDEHGGCYDHVAPERAAAPGDSVNRGWLGTLVHFLLRRKAKAFDFTLLGPRVPAVVVSPFVPAGAVSIDPRDHACIPATLRALFTPQAGRLTGRDEDAAPFHTLAGLDQPRRGADLPDLSRLLPPAPATRATMLAAEAAPPGPEPPVPEYYKDFVKLAELVASELPTAEVAAEAAPDLGPRARAHQVTMAFTRHADQARTTPP
jgi:phospholipase C